MALKKKKKSTEMFHFQSQKNIGIIMIMSGRVLVNEPPRGKTNNVVSEQVRHKPACTSTEKS